MSTRTFDEIKVSVDAAFNSTDAQALMQYAIELDGIGTTEARAMSAHARGYAEAFYNNYAQSLEHYNQALVLCEETGNRAGVASVTSNIGIVYNRLGNHAQALEQWNRAMAMYVEIGNRIGVANTTCNIGNIYSGAGNYAKALEQYHRALEIHTELDARKFMAVDTICIGETYKITGNYPLALENYFRALALYEEIGNRVGIANVIGNIGTVYVYTHNDSQALEYLNRALVIYQELGVRAGEADIIICIGNVYAHTSNYQQALEHFYRAKKLHEEIGEQRSISLVTGSIINALVELGSIAEAEVLLAATEELQIDDPNTAIVLEEIRASIQEHHGQIDVAMQTLRLALATAQEHSLLRVQANIHSQLRDLCQKANDFAGYIEHNNEFTRINDEINGKDTATKLAMQEAENRMAKERQERQREQAILYSTLPKHIADRVIGGEVVNDHIDNAAVMFLDIVGFTTLSSTLTSQQVITLLDAVFKVCDDACNANNVTRIKTIGDSYMAFSSGTELDGVGHSGEVSGTELDGVGHSGTELNATNACMNIARAALQIIEQVKRFDFQSLQVPSSISKYLQVRIGLHCGPVTAGVLGTERLQYDVWGDTVNVASRMESTSEPNRIHVTEQFAHALRSPLRKGEGPGESSRKDGEGPGESSRISLRGETEIKGKGSLTTYWLE